MKVVKKNVLLYCIITASLLLILLLCDALFMHSSVTGTISKNVFDFFSGAIGHLSLPLLVTVIIFAVVFLFPTDKIPRYNWLAGVALFLAVVPPLLEFLKVKTLANGDTHPGGSYGVFNNSIIEKTGNFSYFIYGILVFLSFFIFLFPYRYVLAGVVVNMFTGESHSDTSVKQTRPTRTSNNVGIHDEYRIPTSNDNVKSNDRAERTPKKVKPKPKSDTPPWMTKVTFDIGSGYRIETPMFTSNAKPTKFIYKGEQPEYHIYEQMPEESSVVRAVNSETKADETLPKNEDKAKVSVQNNDGSDYYRKLKEQWPDSWKNPQAKTEPDRLRLPQMQSDEVPAAADSAEDEVVYIQNEEPEIKPQSLNDEEIHNMINNISMPHIEDAELVDDDPISVNEIKSQADSILLDDDEDIFFNGDIDDAADADETENVEIDNQPIVMPAAKNTFSEMDCLPDTDLLQTVEKVNPRIFEAEEQEAAQILESTLLEFKIKATVTDIIHGPVVTLFKVNPAAGVKLTAIENLSNNLAMRLSAKSIRIIAPIPGESVVGIEIPNRKRETVSFKEIINSNEFINTKYNIPIGIGKDIYGRIITLDMYKMPHMLIAGATGSGKSVCVNSFICSILFSRSPDEVRMIMIDPKIVELKPYNDIPHLLAPVITDPRKAITALKYLVYEMERRYELLGNMGVRDITEYRAAIKSGKARMENLPFIVAFVDEFADLMTTVGKDTETLFARITAKARAVGILLVLATQRPSVDVITGNIKANVPARIAFQVISVQDSRTILDQKGADKLLGQGDMLYLSPTQPFPTRLQGAFLSKEEVDSIADHWKSIAEPEYINLEEMVADFENEEEGGETLFDVGGNSEGRDALFEQAIEIARQSGKVSASYLQRRLSIGYNRAANIVETMEEMGMVGPANGSKPRDFLG